MVFGIFFALMDQALTHIIFCSAIVSSMIEGMWEFMRVRIGGFEAVLKSPLVLLHQGML